MLVSMICMLLLPVAAGADAVFAYMNRDGLSSPVKIVFYEHNRKIAKEWYDYHWRLLKREGTIPDGTHRGARYQLCLQYEFTYHNNQRDGISRFGIKGSRQHAALLYKNDRPAGTKFYDANGRLVLERTSSSGAGRLPEDASALTKKAQRYHRLWIMGNAAWALIVGIALGIILLAAIKKQPQ